jgi:cellulose synthase/poly-beta-1,6-N-acetylglucosamine synthase-like glycosyltransferase
MALFAILLGFVAAILAVPSLIFFVECVASLSLGAGGSVARPEGFSVVVLVPAHDEEEGVGPTVLGVRSQLASDDRVLVVADNCSDETAARAEAAGAEVIERFDADRRGKGYALAHGFAHLAAAHPDVVVILDADCRLTPGSIDALIQRVSETGRPAQADYVFSPADRSPLSMISSLATLVKNGVRPRGLRRLGQPCQLTGTGMALPWAAIAAAPELEGNIVEDLAMGAELALLGYEPILCVEAGARSVLPTNRKASTQQRRRWEHGHIATLLQYGPRLISTGMRSRRLGPVALGADLMVPPLSLLVGLLVLVVALSGAVAWFGGPVLPLQISGAAFGLVCVGVGLAWLRYGRQTVPLRYLLMAPLYILWKVPLYLSFLLGRRERQWKRTER